MIHAGHSGVLAASQYTFPLASVGAFDSGFGSAFASVTIDNDGTARAATLNSGNTDFGPWVIPPTAAAAYWCRLSGVSGDTPAGSALNTWLSCGTDRGWSLTATGTEAKACSGTLQFATDAAGAHVVSSIPLDIQATSVEA